jgi:putative nucleotidyltransferase-like protein
MSRPDWMPTPDEELLLDAALGDRDEATRAWRAWREGKTPEGIDQIAFQVLPLVWHNVPAIDPEDALAPILQGVRRHAWIQNQVLLQLAREVVGDLSAAGIDTLILKGVALSTLYYPEPGTRTMTDLDVLVPREEARAAIGVLRERMKPSDPRAEERISVQHAIAFHDQDERELDLHWYSLYRPSRDDEFWAGARPLELGEVTTKALCPADQLVHICAHGAWWHRAPTLRWVADAVLVLRAGEDLDWERLVRQAGERQLHRSVADALDYVRTRFGAPVPPEVPGELRRSPASATQRIAGRTVMNPPGRMPTMLRSLMFHWELHRRLRELERNGSRPRSFPQHLLRFWGYDSYWRFSRYAVRRAFEGHRGEAPE